MKWGGVCKNALCFIKVLEKQSQGTLKWLWRIVVAQMPNLWSKRYTYCCILIVVVQTDAHSAMAIWLVRDLETDENCCIWLRLFLYSLDPGRDHYHYHIRKIINQEKVSMATRFFFGGGQEFGIFTFIKEKLKWEFRDQRSGKSQAISSRLTALRKEVMKDLLEAANPPPCLRSVKMGVLL